eukprot:c19883_g1_i3.p1 GENE.c19883_g1_i3~~c19883_g1_i3.p1  ORF type:complete len:452 (-),score=77.94 c19883_g1_i3:98-1453(-)
MTLHQRSVVDFLSVPLWSKFCEFSIRYYIKKSEVNNKINDESNKILTPSIIDNVRKNYEIATKKCAYEPFHSHILWSSFRTFELEIIDESVNSRILQLFNRQLSFPNSKIESILSEMHSYIKENKLNIIVPSSENLESSILWNELKTFEQNIINAKNISDEQKKNEELFKYWNEYIRVMESKRVKDDSTDSSSSTKATINMNQIHFISSLFERSLIDLNKMELQWLNYLEYSKNYLSEEEEEIISQRSVHNCYWSDKLWIYYLNILEKNNLYDKLIGQYECALSSGINSPIGCFTIFWNYINTIRRHLMSLNFSSNDETFQCITQIRSVFQRARKFISQTRDINKNSELERFWANLEFNLLGDLEKGRELWEIILSRYPNDNSLWKEYITLELRHQNYDKCREIYEKAIKTILRPSSLESILIDWKLFESQFGTLEQYLKSSKVIEVGCSF